MRRAAFFAMRARCNSAQTSPPECIFRRPTIRGSVTGNSLRVKGPEVRIMHTVVRKPAYDVVIKTGVKTMRTITLCAAATIVAALSAPAHAATDRTADSQAWKAWQTMQDREACHTLGTEFKQALTETHDSKAIGHADSIAATAREDCNTGHYQAGREAFDEALASLGATPVPSWGDTAD